MTPRTLTIALALALIASPSSAPPACISCNTYTPPKPLKLEPLKPARGVARPAKLAALPTFTGGAAGELAPEPGEAQCQSDVGCGTRAVLPPCTGNLPEQLKAISPAATKSARFGEAIAVEGTLASEVECFDAMCGPDGARGTKCIGSVRLIGDGASVGLDDGDESYTFYIRGDAHVTCALFELGARAVALGTFGYDFYGGSVVYGAQLCAP